MTRRQRTMLVALIIAAFIIRIGAVLTMRNIYEGPGLEIGDDGVEFNSIALQVAQGNGYSWDDGRPTSFRAPGFPLFLAGLHALSPKNYALIYFAFCTLGALSCLLTFFIARELVSVRQSLVATSLAVVYIPGIYTTTVFASENLFVPCIALAVLFFIRFLKTQNKLVLLMAGLALGWATLTRPFTLLLVPIWLILLVSHYQKNKKQLPYDSAPVEQYIQPRISSPLTSIALLLFSFCITVLPWTARNYATHQRFVLIATNGGSTFYGANNSRVLNERSRLGSWISTTELPGRKEIEAMPDEVSHDKKEWQLGFTWVRENITSLPRLLLYKVIRFWLPDIESANKKYVALQLIGYTPFLLLFVLSWWHCIRDRSYWTSAWLSVHSTIVATVIMALIFWGSPRFRDANMPFLMIHAMLGLTALVSWRSGRIERVR